ncbi:nucleotide sugar dehydrogenase [Paenibacillus lautus]|uniref:nucleotide sugar dehydrogenase n=1 Tax=Paenibacillus lautus TaxID=1401 RepID=UPI002DBD2761|nr:nucleotide sugar dehydrogenase [Paenibacillus lautus]MEC0258395.1 nucleotide sugar dehydrogenase [Paenibacillus lautus]
MIGAETKWDILDKIKSKTATLGVIGLGYVGLPLAVEMANSGFEVIGYDIQEEKVELINRGINYISDVSDADLKRAVESGKLNAKSKFDSVYLCDCVCICVPTPLDKYQQPDISYIKTSAEMLSKFIRPGMLIVLESTTYPGTTEELLKPILEQSGYDSGIDFYLAYSPERVDPGNKGFKIKNTPKVVGGLTPKATEIATALYENVIDSSVHPVSTPAIAEMVKLLENTYRNVNIAFINEMAMLCEKMNIDIWEVIEAAKTKPYGFQAFYPGPGLGGHCIPLDPYYLAWKAREYSFHTSMIEVSGQINDRMAEYCLERSMKILNRCKKALFSSRVLVLGIAYKQDIDDYRESPALRVIECLQREGAEVSFFDPYIDYYIEKETKYSGLPNLTPYILKEFDLVIVTTAHSNIDYDMVQKNSRMIFDTKNAMKYIIDRSNIELL